MRQTVSTVIALTAAALLTSSGCSDSDAPASGRSAVSAATSAASSDAAGPEAELNGVYRTRISRAAYATAVMTDGWTREEAQRVARELPENPAEFELELRDGRFRQSWMPTDEQWQSGTYRLRGDKIVLDDEAPVGTITFAYRLTGSGVRFRFTGSYDPAHAEWRPGIPGYLPAVGFWAATPWERVD